MNFNRKLFKEAFIRGYKEAKRVLRESQEKYSKLFTNLKQFSLENKVNYEITLKQNQRRPVEGVFCARDIYGQGDGRYIHVQRIASVNDVDDPVAYMDLVNVVKANVARDEETGKMTLYIKEEFDDYYGNPTERISKITASSQTNKPGKEIDASII